jgi:hypothetical protein
VKVLEAVHKILFANTELTAEVGNNIAYARVPLTASWPCVHYFDVAQNSDRDMDFDRWTIQISAWSQDKYQAARIKKILFDQFNRLTDYTVAITAGNFIIHRSDIIDAGALPSEDRLLYGSFIRCNIKHRGENIGGL